MRLEIENRELKNMRSFRAFTLGLLSMLASSLPAVAQVPTAPRYIWESPQALSLELEYSLYQWWSRASGPVPNEEIRARLHTGGQSFDIVVNNINDHYFTSSMAITIDEQVKLGDFGLDGRINYG